MYSRSRKRGHLYELTRSWKVKTLRGVEGTERENEGRDEDFFRFNEFDPLRLTHSEL